MSVAPGTSNRSRALKPKLLLDLFASFFLLVNKISRMSGSGRHYTLLKMRILEKAYTFKSSLTSLTIFIEPVLEMINHFLLVQKQFHSISSVLW